MGNKLRRHLFHPRGTLPVTASLSRTRVANLQPCEAGIAKAVHTICAAIGDMDIVGTPDG